MGDIPGGSAKRREARLAPKLGAEKLTPAEQRHEPKVCPECQHVFQGNGWDGIDAHWKARHESVMPYKEAWPLLQAGTYEARRDG